MPAVFSTSRIQGGRIARRGKELHSIERLRSCRILVTLVHILDLFEEIQFH